MPIKRDGKTYYLVGEAMHVFGIGISTLLMWVNAGEVDSYKSGSSDVFVEEQLLRSRIARRFGGRERQ